MNVVESNSIPRNWNGIGNSKIIGVGMELKFENSVELGWKWNWNGIGIENSDFFND